MGLFVSTISTNISISELGITLVHPAVDFQISSQFSPEEISRAISLTSAITGGTLIWRKTAGGANELAANYDPDFIDLENEAGGSGNQLDKAPRWIDFDAQEAFSVSDTNTNSGSDVAINSSSLTCTYTGEYEAIFTTTIGGTSNNAIVRFTIYVNGVAQTRTTRQFIPRSTNSSNLTVLAMTNGKVAVLAGQVIEVRWRTTAGTVTAHERSLNIKRVK